MTNSLRKYKMVIAYDGSLYGGWQVQNNAPSIQSIIQETLHIILQIPVQLIGSGRTDAGVHALGQVAHFVGPDPISLLKVQMSLNRLLPPTIRILKIDPAASSFHARYSAKSKTYHYHLDLNSVADPFKRLYAYHPHHTVNLDLLKKAASYFVGTHDFTSFSHRAHQGSAAQNPIRTLYRLDVIEKGQEVRLEFEGDGFLYKMVRNIVGTLLDICAGKLKWQQIPEIFSSKDRRLAGKTAPAQGLFLVEVQYDD